MGCARRSLPGRLAPDCQQTMRIRGYHPEDLDTLFEIDQACFPSGVAYSKRGISHFTSQRGAMTWVAEDGKEIVGFLIAEHDARAIGHIVTIDVVLSWRRKGVGRALMDEVDRWASAQGLKMLYLETAEDNLTAQRFYEARDYIKLEKIEGYYGDGGAAWVMGKRLKPTR